jgi:membrane protease subunit HflC
MTRDPQRNTIDKTLTIDAYVCWRIADAEGVDRFLRTVGSMELARTILAQRISGDLGAQIGQMEMNDLVSTEAGRVDERREHLRRLLLEGGRWWRQPLVTSAREKYGIELVDVRLRRANYPAEVHEAIFERIRSKRAEKVIDYQSEGEQIASGIRSASDRRVSRIRARAEAEAVRVRGRAEAQADRIRNQAQGQDPDFYAFLKRLEAYKSILGDGKTLLLLSLQRDLFRPLNEPPGPGAPPKRAPGNGKTLLLLSLQRDLFRPLNEPPGPGAPPKRAPGGPVPEMPKEGGQ